MSDWYKAKSELVLQQLKSDALLGLSGSEALARLKQFGPNQLLDRGGRNPWKILLSQFTSTVVIVLLLSTLVTALIGDRKNAISILVIVALNATLGFIQEFRAEKALSALKKMAVPQIKVRRNGRIEEISARDVVPGDLILLEAGTIVPADGRVLESANLRTQESALTGESEAVEKHAAELPASDLPLGDRRNMAYSGTVVAYGRGLMVATETGMATQIGHIASMIQGVTQEPTPLQKRLDQVGSRLAYVALAIVVGIFVLGLVRGEELKHMFLTAVSIAVAAIPEGLPAVVTINLAIGAQRMLKKKALIRQLPAVETLGSVSVICSDKTGTLTENKMAVAILDMADHQIDLRNIGLGETVVIPGPTETLERKGALNLLLTGGALCNDAVMQAAEGGRYHAIGDPTEAALTIAAARFGFIKSDLERVCPRVREFPFDSERKRMCTVHRVAGDIKPFRALGVSHVALVKGAVDGLLEISSHVWADGIQKNMDDAWRTRIRAAQNHLAQNGMRVMGVAFRNVDPALMEVRHGREKIESDLTFVGLIGLIDPLRAGVSDAVSLCLQAGIMPKMITGDHPLTAEAIAKELHYLKGRPLTGAELDRLSTSELEALVEKTSVFARVTPEHKLKIVQALQNHGHIVAMTGDGINDAPALKKADIGIAMGITGTDVAKEAADMILLDDNFSTIVAAVEEGRVIYENIRKFLRYMLTGNIGEIWVMFLAPFLGMPLPLLPIQILWMNLVTDGLPALALGVEPPEKNVMRHPPIPPNENILGRGMGWQIMRLGAMVGFVPLVVGLWYWRKADPAWQTMIFTTLIALHVEMALSFRSEQSYFFELPFFSNKPLLVAVSMSLLLQMAVVYVPFLQSVFHTVPLSGKDLAISLALSTALFWLAELEKAIRRRVALGEDPKPV